MVALWFHPEEPTEAVVLSHNTIKPLLTPRQIGALFGVTARSVLYWVDDGCPYYDILGLKRFRESEVKRWVRKRSMRAAGESNPVTGLRRPQSEHIGQPKQGPDRREYMRGYQREWVGSRRAAWFAGKACQECGATEDLQIHHRDPGEKVANSIWSWSDERRDEELAKCDVLCVDCHKKQHGPMHGGKRRYEAGCRCADCVEGMRMLRAAKRARKRRAIEGSATR